MNRLYNGIMKKEVVVLMLLVVCITGFSQKNNVSGNLNKAVQYFENGDYVNAYAEFEKYKQEYLENTESDYYMGVCLLNMNERPDESITLLNNCALNNCRKDVHFYLFVAYFKSNLFDKAEISLANFSNLAKKKERKKKKVTYWENELKLAREKYENKKKTTEKDATGEEQTEEGKDGAGVEEVLEVKEIENKYNNILEQALLTQLVCDSLKSELTDLKNSLREEPDEESRKKLFSKISSTQKELEEQQLKADDLFKKAEKFRNDNTSGDIDITENNPVEERINENIYLDKEYNGIKLYAYKTGLKKTEVKKETEIKEKTKNSSVSQEFKVLLKSPYSKEAPIPFNVVIPDGLVYRIQLGVYSQELSPNAFGGLSPVSAEYMVERKLTKYFVGIFYTSIEAKKALEQVKDYGYPDAFLVPYYNQHKISIQLARDKEFGEKK